MLQQRDKRFRFSTKHLLRFGAVTIGAPTQTKRRGRLILSALLASVAVFVAVSAVAYADGGLNRSSQHLNVGGVLMGRIGVCSR